MDITTAQQIDALLANETFPTFINPVDILNTLQLKQTELRQWVAMDNKPQIRKCCFEIAAITINFLESGVLRP